MPEPRRTGLVVVLALATGLALVIAGYWFVALLAKVGGSGMTDLAVYRGAVLSMLDGRGLYDYALLRPGESALPFTYPPFAALVFVPVAVLPSAVSAWLVVVASLAACVGLAHLVLRHGSRWRGGRVPALPLALASLALLVSEPVGLGVILGQISLFLVLASLADACGVLPRRWQGVLIGLAGAIKLIPLVFIPYFLITRQWRRAVNATVAFGVATGLGLVVLPGESVRYWTQLVFDTSRVGELVLSRNKSLLGLVARWDLGGDHQRLVWLALAALIAVLGLWAASRHHRRGEELAAALVVGTLSIVLTPISWPHHQVWMTLVALYLILQERRWTIAAGSALLLGYVFASPLFSWLETGPLWLRLSWELPTLAAVAVSVLGLPQDRPIASVAAS